MSCHCEVDMLNTECILPFSLAHLLLSFIKPVSNSLLTQQKSCHTYLYSNTVVLPQPWNSHSWILIWLQFYGFGFKVFSTPQFSLLSKVYLPWLSQVLKKWSIFLFSKRAVVIADKQTVSRRNFIPTVSSSVSKNGLAIAPVLVHGSHLSIWKAFSYVVQHKTIPCSKCRKLKHLLK